MSDDEVKQEVKGEHINIKVRDMVRERATTRETTTRARCILRF